MVKVAKSRVADRNIGLPAFHLCYSLEVALNRLAIGGIGSEKKIRHVLVGGGCIPLIPPSGSAPVEHRGHLLLHQMFSSISSFLLHCGRFRNC